MKIEERNEVKFLEIGLDDHHTHFLIQSIPINLVKKIISAVKIITAKEMFCLHPEVKNKFWERNFEQVVIMSIQLVNIAMKK